MCVWVVEQVRCTAHLRAPPVFLMDGTATTFLKYSHRASPLFPMPPAHHRQAITSCPCRPEHLDTWASALQHSLIPRGDPELALQTACMLLQLRSASSALAVLVHSDVTPVACPGSGALGWLCGPKQNKK